MGPWSETPGVETPGVFAVARPIVMYGDLIQPLFDDLPFILKQLVLYGVHQREPTGLDDVFADADRAPAAL